MLEGLGCQERGKMEDHREAEGGLALSTELQRSQCRKSLYPSTSSCSGTADTKKETQKEIVIHKTDGQS